MFYALLKQYPTKLWFITFFQFLLISASAGPTGMAAAAAISSTKKRKKSFAFETNPSIRKRQQTRILRKLRQNIEEYSLRVGQQAVVLVATPGGGKSSQVNFR